MDTSSVALLVYAVISIVIAFIAHWSSRSYWLTSCLAAIVASIGFQVFVYFQAGHLDPFFLIALAISAGVSFLIALLVGLPFISFRRKRDEV
jgi:hypothetical protein